MTVHSSSPMLHPAGLSPRSPKHSLSGKAASRPSTSSPLCSHWGARVAGSMHDTPGIPGMPGPRGSWHEADQPCVVPHQQSEDISPLQLSHHLPSVLPDFLLFRDIPSLKAQWSGFSVSRMAAGGAQPITSTGELSQRGSLELGVPQRTAGAMLILLPTCTFSGIFLLNPTMFPSSVSCRHAAILSSNTKKQR